MRRTFKLRRVTAAAVLGMGMTAGVIGVTAGVAGAAPQHSKRSSQPKVVANFSNYVGGHGEAKRNLSPVYIGIVNQATAPAALAPSWSTMAQLAGKYLNGHTNGIDGHPVKLVLCKIPTTVSSAAKCGEEFANNAKISAVIVGAVDVGNTALESALKPTKKPVFFGISANPIDQVDPDGFILQGTSTGVGAVEATFVKRYLHVTAVTLTYPADEPADVAEAAIADQSLKYVGINKVYKVGFTSADTNLTGTFDAGHIRTTTLLMFITSGPVGCADTYLTLKDLHLSKKNVLAIATCDTPTVAKADGGQLPHNWYYANALPMSQTTSGLKSFKQVLGQYHRASTVANPWMIDAWATVLTVARLDTEVLKSGERITPTTVTAKARIFKGPLVLGPPALDCRGTADKPAICSKLVAFFRNTEPGMMKQITPYIGPPKGFGHG